jgi:hypothetical protein
MTKWEAKRQTKCLIQLFQYLAGINTCLIIDLANKKEEIFSRKKKPNLSCIKRRKSRKNKSQNKKMLKKSLNKLKKSFTKS